jgi:hypothetical protein
MSNQEMLKLSCSFCHSKPGEKCSWQSQTHRQRGYCYGCDTPLDLSKSHLIKDTTHFHSGPRVESFRICDKCQKWRETPKKIPFTVSMEVEAIGALPGGDEIEQWVRGALKDYVMQRKKSRGGGKLSLSSRKLSIEDLYCGP